MKKNTEKKLDNLGKKITKEEKKRELPGRYIANYCTDGTTEGLTESIRNDWKKIS